MPSAVSGVQAHRRRHTQPGCPGSWRPGRTGSPGSSGSHQTGSGNPHILAPQHNLSGLGSLTGPDNLAGPPHTQTRAEESFAGTPGLWKQLWLCL